MTDALMRNYARFPVEFVRGEGVRLWDSEGNEYLDFLTGISVCNTGHCHPQVVAAVQEQVARLMHVGNLYFTRPMVELAERLAARSLGGRVYFANSGGLVQGWDVAGIADGRTPERVFRFWTGDDTDATVVIGADGALYVASEYERETARSKQVGQVVKLDPSRPDDPLVWSFHDVQMFCVGWLRCLNSSM